MLTVGTVKVLQHGLFSAYVDLIAKRRGKAGVDNAFLRELAMLHANTAFEDLDKDFQRDITTASSIILSYINKMGFNLVPKEQ